LLAYTGYKFPPVCEEISSGYWQVTTNPKYGKITTGEITGHLDNGQCPDKTFTFAAIYYEWTAHTNNTALPNQLFVGGKANDFVYAIWQAITVTPFPFEFEITVPLVRPSSETTAFAAWAPTGADGGTGKWKQTLHPPADDPTFVFDGESVQEANPGGGGPDTCWFAGSAFLQFTGITGGTWTVAAGQVTTSNDWGFDYVGWHDVAVDYYRLHHRAPCGTTFPQQMTIKSPTDDAYVNYGTVNTLGGSFTATTETSLRAGHRKTRTH